MDNEDPQRDEQHPLPAGLESPVPEEIQPEPEAPVRRGPEFRDYPATLVLIGLILAGYALSTYPSFKAPSELAVKLGAFYGPAILDGQWWRIFTVALLHGDFNHLLNNLFGLLIFGQMLEPVFGSVRMILLFLFANILGFIVSCLMSPDSVSIGASAIDYGLIGSYIGLVLAFRYRTDRATFHQELKASFMFVLIFVAWDAMQLQKVNSWAHLGGMIAGVLFALQYANGLRKEVKV